MRIAILFCVSNASESEGKEESNVNFESQHHDRSQSL